MACPLFARLFGQLRPSFMSLPVLNKNLHEPPKRMALDDIKRAPTQIRGDQVAIGLFVFVFNRDDKAFGLVSADL